MYLKSDNLASITVDNNVFYQMNMLGNVQYADTCTSGNIHSWHKYELTKLQCKM